MMLSFVLMAIIVVISPGPNFILITRSLSTNGKSPALANIPGFALAYFVHGSLSVFGISALIIAEPSLLIGTQLLGAVFLLYLGVKSILATRGNQLIENVRIKTPSSDYSSKSEAYSTRH